MIYIGIDTGTHTGFAVWDSYSRKFECTEEYQLHEALEMCLELKNRSVEGGSRLFGRVEDARQRTWFDKPFPERKKGRSSREWVWSKGTVIFWRSS